MPTDDEYGQQLGVQLRHETADVHPDPNLVGTLRRRQARRTWAIRTATATPVAMAAAAAAMLITTAGPGTPVGGFQANDAAPPAADSPVQLQNVAYVREQTIEALSNASQYVIYSKSTYGNDYHETWVDKATQRSRSDNYGRPVRGSKHQPMPSIDPNRPVRLYSSYSASGPQGNQDIVRVDYDQKMWMKSHDTTQPPASPEPDITDADGIRKAITDGTLELLGAEKVDGLDTLHLQFFVGPNRVHRIDMWVDSKTYLPVKEISAKGGPEFPAEAQVTTKYSWLPRTEENLAKLVLTPPPGFEERR